LAKTSAGGAEPGRPIIIDCDPGHDDALAILLALASPALRVLGITTVAGNASVQHTTENALRVLALAGRADIPVAVGAAGPRHGSLRTSPQVHGESGLAGAELPDPVSEPVREDAVAFIASTLAASSDRVTLVPVGPLTNVAAFIDTHPDLLEWIERICLMGGAIAEGNTTPSAEFNIWCARHASPVQGVSVSVSFVAFSTAAREKGNVRSTSPR
jgi:pyrimidine-specific ribonucleoside hydrolase